MEVWPERVKLTWDDVSFDNSGYPTRAVYCSVSTGDGHGGLASLRRYDDIIKLRIDSISYKVLDCPGSEGFKVKAHMVCHEQKIIIYIQTIILSKNLKEHCFVFNIKSKKLRDHSSLVQGCGEAIKADIVYVEDGKVYLERLHHQKGFVINMTSKAFTKQKWGLPHLLCGGKMPTDFSMVRDV